MSLSFIDGRYVRNLTEDTSQGGAKYENGDYTRAVVVGNNVQSGVTQNGALDGVPIEFVLERINSQNIPVINVLDSYTAARAIASLRARGSDAHLWLPGVGTLNGLTTGNYLESTGNSIATVDNPCGLVLDALGSAGVEKLADTGFDSDAAWSKSPGVTVSGGSANWVALASNTQVYQNSVIESGKTYLATFTISTISVGGLKVSLGAESPVYSVAGTYSSILTATITQAKIMASGASTTAAVTYFSVREVSGIHLTQGTTANKPLLRRGLTNLLRYSEQFTGAAVVPWGSPANVTITDANVTADGISLARFVKAASGDCTVRQGPTVSAGMVHSYTAVFHVLKDEDETRFPEIAVFGSGTGADEGTFWFLNTKTGATTVRAVAGSPTVNTIDVVSLGSVWQIRIVLTSALTTHNKIELIFRPTAGTAWGTYDSAAPGTIYAGHAALFQGTLTASEILAAGGIPVTTTAAASNPDAGKYSWAFDGSNDSLALGSVPFQMGDDHCVIAGLAPASNVSDGYAFNPASGAGTQMAGCLLVTSAGYAKAAWWDDTTLIAITDNVGRANTSFVASAVKVVNAKRLRVNGTQSGATETTPMGTTTVTGASIGAYSPTGGNKYRGQTGPVLAIKGTVTDAELLMYERLIAALTPGAPSF